MAVAGVMGAFALSGTWTVLRNARAELQAEIAGNELVSRRHSCRPRRTACGRTRVYTNVSPPLAHRERRVPGNVDRKARYPQSTFPVMTQEAVVPDDEAHQDRPMDEPALCHAPANPVPTQRSLVR
jgi:hypothetical protein